MQKKHDGKDQLIIRAARPGRNDFGNGIADVERPPVTVESIVASMETRIVSEGSLEGENFKVLDWQRDAIASLLCVPETLVSMSRGNGKTTFFANLACEWLDGQMTFPRAQIVLVASSLKQGRICFEHIKYFMGGEDRFAFERYTPKPTPHNPKPASRKRWLIRDNTHECHIEDKKTGVKLFVVGSDSKRAHGLAPTVLLCDEPAQWQKGGRKLFNALKGGLGKQPNGRMFIFGTLPESGFHWFRKRIEKPDRQSALLPVPGGQGLRSV